MMRPDLMPRVDVQHVGGAPIFVMNRVMRLFDLDRARHAVSTCGVGTRGL